MIPHFIIDLYNSLDALKAAYSLSQLSYSKNPETGLLFIECKPISGHNFSLIRTSTKEDESKFQGYLDSQLDYYLNLDDQISKRGQPCKAITLLACLNLKAKFEDLIQQANEKCSQSEKRFLSRFPAFSCILVMHLKKMTEIPVIEDPLEKLFKARTHIEEQAWKELLSLMSIVKCLQVNIDIWTFEGKRELSEAIQTFKEHPIIKKSEVVKRVESILSQGFGKDSVPLFGEFLEKLTQPVFDSTEPNLEIIVSALHYAACAAQIRQIPNFSEFLPDLAEALSDFPKTVSQWIYPTLVEFVNLSAQKTFKGSYESLTKAVEDTITHLPPKTKENKRYFAVLASFDLGAGSFKVLCSELMEYLMEYCIDRLSIQDIYHLTLSCSTIAQFKLIGLKVAHDPSILERLSPFQIKQLIGIMDEALIKRLASNISGRELVHDYNIRNFQALRSAIITPELTKIFDATVSTEFYNHNSEVVVCREGVTEFGLSIVRSWQDQRLINRLDFSLPRLLKKIPNDEWFDILLNSQRIKEGSITINDGYAQGLCLSIVPTSLEKLTLKLDSFSWHQNTLSELYAFLDKCQNLRHFNVVLECGSFSFQVCLGHCWNIMQHLPISLESLDMTSFGATYWADIFIFRETFRREVKKRFNLIALTDILEADHKSEALGELSTLQKLSLKLSTLYRFDFISLNFLKNLSNLSHLEFTYMVGKVVDPVCRELLSNFPENLSVLHFSGMADLPSDFNVDTLVQICQKQNLKQLFINEHCIFTAPKNENKEIDASFLKIPIKASSSENPESAHQVSSIDVHCPKTFSEKPFNFSHITNLESLNIIWPYEMPFPKNYFSELPHSLKEISITYTEKMNPHRNYRTYISPVVRPIRSLLEDFPCHLRTLKLLVHPEDLISGVFQRFTALERLEFGLHETTQSRFSKTEMIKNLPPSLKHLKIDSWWGYHDIVDFSNLTVLTSLILTGLPDRYDLIDLHKLKLGALRRLELHGYTITAKNIQTICAFENLRFLTVGNRIKTDALSHIFDLPKSLRELRLIGLDPNIDPKFFSDFEVKFPNTKLEETYGSAMRQSNRFKLHS